MHMHGSGLCRSFIDSLTTTDRLHTILVTDFLQTSVSNANSFVLLLSFGESWRHLGFVYRV